MRMINFKFDIESQKDRYNAVKDNIKNKDKGKKSGNAIQPQIRRNAP